MQTNGSGCDLHDLKETGGNNKLLLKLHELEQLELL